MSLPNEPNRELNGPGGNGSDSGATLWNHLDRIGLLLENGFLVIILTAMIGLAASQIVLRNIWDIGFSWSDELLRLMVLWIAIAGAVSASRFDKHINIAVLDRFLPTAVNAWIKVITHAFTAGISALLTWFSARFVMTTYEYQDVLLGDIPAWLLQAVLPVGFALITWRYFLFTITSVYRNLVGAASTADDRSSGNQP